MEFLVGFDVTVPEGTPESEVKERVSAEATAAADLARQGHLVRLWRPRGAPGERKVVGLYRAEGEAELDGLLAALPHDGGMKVTVNATRAASERPGEPAAERLPTPRHPSNGWRRCAVCPVTGCTARQRRDSGPPGSRRGGRCERVHVPHLDPDRDGRRRARLAEQGGVRERWRGASRAAWSTRPTLFNEHSGRDHQRRVAGHRSRPRTRSRSSPRSSP